MSNVFANINVVVNTAQAVKQLAQLQTQAVTTAKAISAAGATNPAASKAAAQAAKDFQQAAAASQLFTARMLPATTAVDSFNDHMMRSKFSLGQYAQYAFAASKTADRFGASTQKASLINKVAAERVKALATQYVTLANNMNGAAQVMAITPTHLNRQASATAMAIEKQRLMNMLIADGSTKLLNWGKNTQWAGRQLMVGFTLPLTIFAGVAVAAFNDIEKQALEFKKVYGDLFTTEQETQKNLKAIKDLGVEFTKYGIAVKDTMKLATTAAAAGQKDAELIAATTEATRLSVLGQMDAQQAMETTISLQTAFGLSNKQLAESVDFLNAVENQTILTLSDVTEAIPRAATVINSMGGSVKDLSVLLVAMKEGGVSAAEGSNAVKNSLARLITPTKAAREMARGFGIDLELLVKNNRGKLLLMLTELGTKINSLGGIEQQQLLSTIFGKYQYARIGTMLKSLTNDSSQAATAIELMNASVRDLANTSERELGRVEQSASTKAKAAMEKIKVGLSPIGEEFLNAAMPILNFIGELIKKFNELPDGVKNFAVKLTTIVGVIAPVFLMLLGLMGNMMAQGIKVVQFFRRIHATLTGNGKAFQRYSLEELQAETMSKALQSQTINTNGALMQQTATVGALNAELAVYVSNLRAAAAASAGVGMLPNRGAVAATAARTATAAVKAPPIQFRNTGGEIFDSSSQTYVPGVGNRDTVPAVLTPGEFVVNKQSTRENLPLLEAINSGKIVAKNKGGMIPGVQYFNASMLQRIVQPFTKAGRAIRARAAEVAKFRPDLASLPRAGRESGKYVYAAGNYEAGYKEGVFKSRSNLDNWYGPGGYFTFSREIPNFYGKRGTKRGGPERYLYRAKLSQKDYTEKFLNLDASAAGNASFGPVVDILKSKLAKQSISSSALPSGDITVKRWREEFVRETQSRLMYNGLPADMAEMTAHRLFTNAVLESGLRGVRHIGSSEIGKLHNVAIHYDTPTNLKRVRRFGKPVTFGFGGAVPATGRTSSILGYMSGAMVKQALSARGLWNKAMSDANRWRGTYPDLFGPNLSATKAKISVSEKSLSRYHGTPDATSYAYTSGSRAGRVYINPNDPDLASTMIHEISHGSRGRRLSHGTEEARAVAAQSLRYGPQESYNNLGLFINQGTIDLASRGHQYGRNFQLDYYNESQRLSRKYSQNIIRTRRQLDRAEGTNVSQLNRRERDIATEVGPRPVSQTMSRNAERVARQNVKIGYQLRGYKPVRWDKTFVTREGDTMTVTDWLRGWGVPESSLSAMMRKDYFDPSLMLMEMRSRFGVEAARETKLLLQNVTGRTRFGRKHPEIALNTGNQVPGIGNKDTVPAMLTPGEFVVNKQATADNLPLLHAINDGVLGMNIGGRVPGVQYFAADNPERVVQSKGKRLEFLHLEDPRAASEEQTRAIKGDTKNKRMRGSGRASFNLYNNLGIVGPRDMQYGLGGATGTNMAKLFTPQLIDRTMSPFYKGYADALTAATGVPHTVEQAMNDPKARKSIRALGERFGAALTQHGAAAVTPSVFTSVLNSAQTKADPILSKAIPTMRTVTTAGYNKPGGGAERGSLSSALQRNLFGATNPVTSYRSWWSGRTGEFLNRIGFPAQAGEISARKMRASTSQVAAAEAAAGHTPMMPMMGGGVPTLFGGDVVGGSSRKAISRHIATSRDYAELRRHIRYASQAGFTPEAIGKELARVNKELRAAGFNKVERGQMLKNYQKELFGRLEAFKKGAVEARRLGPEYRALYQNATRMAQEGMTRSQISKALLQSSASAIMGGYVPAGPLGGVLPSQAPLQNVMAYLEKQQTAKQANQRNRFGIRTNKWMGREGATFFNSGYTVNQQGQRVRQMSGLQRGMARGGSMIGSIGMMASMAPMFMTDEQGQFMGMNPMAAMGGIMGISMIAQMIPQMVMTGGAAAAMGVALGAVTAGLVAGGLALKGWRDSVNNGAKAAADLGANLGGASNGLNKIATVLGTDTPAQRQAKLQMGFTAEEQQLANDRWGQLLGAEEGQAFLKELKALSTADRVTRVEDYTRKAIATGMLTVDDAKSFTKSVASALSDPVLGTAVLSSIRSGLADKGALRDIAEQRLREVQASAIVQGAKNATGTLGTNEAAYAIGASLQVVQDYANVAALAREQYASGVIAFEEYNDTIRNASKVQTEYAETISNAIRLATDPQGARMALDNQLTASGLTEEQIDAITHSTDIGRSAPLGLPFMGFGQGSNTAYVSDYINREMAARGVQQYDGEALTQAYLDLQQEARDAQDRAVRMYEMGLNEDLKAATASGIFTADQAAALGTELMNNANSAGAIQYEKMKGRGQGILGLQQAGFINTSNALGIAGLNDKGLKKYIDVGLRFSEQGGSLAQYQAFINNIPSTVRTNIVTSFTNMGYQQQTAVATATEGIVGAYGDKANSVTGSLAYGAAVRAAETRYVDEYDRGTGKVVTKPVAGNERPMKALEGAALGAEKALGADTASSLMSAAYELTTKANGQEVDPTEFASNLGDLTQDVLEIERNLPEEVLSQISLDFTSSDSIEHWNTVAKQTEANWLAISGLNPNIKLSAYIEYLTVDAEGNPLTPEQVSANTVKLNAAWNTLETSKNVELRKDAIFTLVTSARDSAGNPLPLEAAEQTWDALVAEYGVGKVATLSPDVMIKAVEMFFDATQMEEQASRIEAQLGNITDEEMRKNLAGKAADLRAAASALRAKAVTGVKPHFPTGSKNTGGGGGGGDKTDALKTMREDLLNQIKMYVDAAATVKTLNDAKRNFVNMVLGGKGIFNQLLDIKGYGLPTSMLQKIADLGPKDAARWLKKYTTVNKNGVRTLNKAGQLQVDQTMAAASRQSIGMNALAVRDSERNAAAIANLRTQPGVNEDVVEFIAQDPERMGQLSYHVDQVNKGVRGAKKAMQLWLESQIDAVNAAKEWDDALKTPVQRAQDLHAESMDRINAAFDFADAKIEMEANARFTAERGMTPAAMEKEIRIQQDKIDGYKDETQAIQDVINGLERRTAAADKPYGEWGVEQLQRENELINQQIREKERLNEMDQRKIDVYQHDETIRQQAVSAINHELDVMSQKEDEIQKVYDKRIEALDEIAKINDHILAQQRNQINLANALTTGDIAAAATARQEMQAQDAQYSIDNMRQGLQDGMESQIGALTTSEGLTRDEAEAKLNEYKNQSYQTTLLINQLEEAMYQRNLTEIMPLKDKQYNIESALQTINNDIYTKQQEILKIERDKIEPATRNVEKMTEYLDDLRDSVDNQKADVAILGLKRDTWELIDNYMNTSLTLSDLMSQQTVEQAGYVQQLAQQWQGVAEQIKNARDAMTKDIAKIEVKPLTKTYTKKDRDAEIAAATASYTSTMNTLFGNMVTANRDAIANMFTGGEIPASVQDAMNILFGTGKPQLARISTDKKGDAAKAVEIINNAIDTMNAGDYKASRNYYNDAKKFVQAANDSSIRGTWNQIDGILDQMGFAAGGSVPGIGSRDSVSARLTPGEYVIRKASVAKYGRTMFDRINSGAFELPRYNATAPTASTVSVGGSRSDIDAPTFNTFSINVNVPNTNASPDAIANKVMMKLANADRMGIRSIRGNK